MQDLRADDRVVFVVSSSGTDFSENIKDGIRYINLPSLWNENGTVNKDFRVLRIKTNNDKVYYEIKEVF